MARTELAFLLLDILVTHMHVVLHGRHILMAQQLLQAERSAAQLQVADGKGVAEAVRIDPFIRDPCSLLQPKVGWIMG